MRVMVVAGGSRGDVEPLVALGCGVRDAGHEVTVAAVSDLAGFVTSRGLAHHDLGYTADEQMRSASGSAWIGTASGNPVRELRLLLRIGAEWAPRIAASLLPLLGRADLYVSGVLSLDAVDALARHDGVPHRTALLSPFHPSADGRVVLLPPLPRHRSPLNRVSAAIATRVATASFGLTGRALRPLLGMPADGGSWAATLARTPAVLGASPLLVPPPADWPASVHVTGHWPLPPSPGAALPPDLDAFLAAGPPPVYLGFGSMDAVASSQPGDLLRDAARRAGVRAVVRRHGTPSTDGGDVLEIADVPHDLLLPRTAAVVHHGGAGTTHAALRAGVPSAAVPHIGDQPYWGRRLHEVGVGARPLPRHRLDVDRLAALLRDLTADDDRAARARRAGARLRAEDGVATAVRALGLAD